MITFHSHQESFIQLEKEMEEKRAVQEKADSLSSQQSELLERIGKLQEVLVASEESSAQLQEQVQESILLVMFVSHLPFQFSE